MEELKAIVAHSARKLMGKANVVGVGLGYKETGGRLTNTQAIVVLVTRKVPPGRLRRRDLVPKALSAITTDVIEVGELRILPAPADAAPALDDDSRKVRLRPAMPGISVGHYQITAGTFGALVYDRETGVPLILSNNHVLANISNGGDGRAEAGDPIYQPGRYDGGGQNDTIAHLERFVPIVRTTETESCPIARQAEKVGNLFLKSFFPAHTLELRRRTNGDNPVDAAVAAVLEPDQVSGEIMGLGQVRGAKEAEPGLKVVKSGRTSGISRGEVRAVGATVRVGLGEVGTAVFTDQIVTTAMAEPGDSGSLLLADGTMEAVGLLSAGSSLATIHGRINAVLELLDVSLTPTS